MIKKFRLHNFKAFQDTGEIEIKPLTILAGANSSGKSSVLQGLLVLKQTLETEYPHPALNLDGRYLQASGLDDVTFNKPPRSVSEIGFDFLVAEDRESTSKKLISEYFPQFIKMEKDIKLNGDICFCFRYGRIPSEKKEVKVSSFDIQTHIDGVLGPKLSLRQRGGRYMCNISGNGANNIKIKKLGKARSVRDMDFYYFTPYEYLVIDKEHTRVDLVKLDEIFERLLFKLRWGLKEIQYLGPLREWPQRAYLHSGSPFGEIGKSGEYAAQILWLEKDEKVKYIQHLGEEPKEITLLEAVRNAFQNMGIIQPIDVSSVKRVMYQIIFGITDRVKGKAVTIADVGFGISQLLPVVVMGLQSPEDSLLIFEQPEIHLQPKLQANLADFLISLALQGKRIIVETHSEHLINRLRRRIVEDSSDQIKDMVSILFVKPPQFEKSATIEKLKIDRYGIIENWPHDFLPEAADEAAVIFRKSLEKRSTK